VGGRVEMGGGWGGGGSRERGGGGRWRAGWKKGAKGGRATEPVDFEEHVCATWKLENRGRKNERRALLEGGFRGNQIMFLKFIRRISRKKRDVRREKEKETQPQKTH